MRDGRVSGTMIFRGLKSGAVSRAVRVPALSRVIARSRSRAATRPSRAGSAVNLRLRRWPKGSVADQARGDRGARHRRATKRNHLPVSPVQRQIGPPFGKRGQLAPYAVSLTFRRQAAALAFQNGPVVHKARRQPKIMGGLSAPRADKGDDPTARFHRLRSARPDPPLSGRIGDLQNPACEIPQPEAMRQASGLMVFCGAKHIF